MTNAERQRKSREAIAKAGGKKLSVNINAQAVNVLEQLTKEFGSEKKAIEYVILQNEQRILLWESALFKVVFVGFC